MISVLSDIGRRYFPEISPSDIVPQLRRRIGPDTCYCVRFGSSVLKLPSSPSPLPCRTIRYEHSVLTRLAQTSVGAYLPKNNCLWESGGSPVLKTDYIKGLPFYDLIDQDLSGTRIRSDFDLALRVLKTLSHSMSSTRYAGHIFDRVYRRSLTQVRARVGLGDLEMTLPRIREFGHVGMHGDFNPWNMMITESGCAVLDWEDFSPRGFAGFDFFYFTIGYLWVCLYGEKSGPDGPVKHPRTIPEMESLYATFRQTIADILPEILEMYQISFEDLTAYFHLFLLHNARKDLAKKRQNIGMSKRWLTLLPHETGELDFWAALDKLYDLCRIDYYFNRGEAERVQAIATPILPSLRFLYES